MEYRNYGVQRLAEFVESLTHQADVSDEYPHDAPTLSNEQLAAMASDVLATFNRYYQEPSGGNGWKCPACGHAEKCQGWANWETWNTALWLDNGEVDQQFMYAVVEESGSVRKAADYLKDYFSDGENVSSEVAELLDSSGLYSDLLQAGIDAIDWHEIAAHFKPDEWGDADEAPADTDESEGE